MSVEALSRFRSLEDAADYAGEADPRSLCETLAGLAEAHDALFDRTLDLVGSHGLMSPRARAMLGTGLVDKMRQTGLPGRRIHAGGHWLDRVETIAIALAKRLFGVAFAELRPMSCALANGLVFAALAERGDTILAQSRRHGADPSITADAFGNLLGHRYADLPFDEARFAIDIEGATRAIEKTKPRLVVVGSGFILFPYPVKELKAACARVGARLFYDGAHAVGLTAGRHYQDPMAEGADVATGSVPKTLCGPIGGIILSNDPEVAGAIERTTNRIVSSYANNHVGALAVTLAEMLEFGKAYADTVVANAKALARALDRAGFPVLAKSRGFTESHLVLVDVRRQGAVEAVRRLEAAGMFTTPIRLPSGSPLVGMRLGTASVTRRGMGEGEMTEIASFMRRVLLEGEDPAVIGGEAAALASSFTKVHYCFD
ncbi:MAG: aminotransferase class I/II-fold pyridoxal phosphate-dependent enzyme [Proteobacteria bacterium]|nr:aminotransferase class I/II-fold pyridoxal phosphate-dependent enzyme [Pseudomonadota bacterium]